MVIQVININSLTEDDALCTLIKLESYTIMLQCGLSKTLNLQKYQQNINLLQNVRLVLISQSSISCSGALPFILSWLHPSHKIVSTQAIYNLAPYNLHQALVAAGHSQYNISFFKRINETFDGIVVKPWQTKTIFDIGIKIGCCNAGHTFNTVYWVLWIGISCIVYIPYHNLKSEKHIRSLNLQFLKDKNIDLLITQFSINPQTQPNVAQIIQQFINKQHKIHYMISPSQRVLQLYQILKMYKCQNSLCKSHFDLLRNHVQFMSQQTDQLGKIWESSIVQSKAHHYLGSQRISSKYQKDDFIIIIKDIVSKKQKPMKPNQHINLNLIPVLKNDIQVPEIQKKQQPKPKQQQHHKQIYVQHLPFLRFAKKKQSNQSHTIYGQNVPQQLLIDQRISPSLPSQIVKKVTIQKKKLIQSDFILKQYSVQSIVCQIQGWGLSNKKDCKMLVKYLKPRIWIDLPCQNSVIDLLVESSKIRTDLQMPINSIYRVKGQIKFLQQQQLLKILQKEQIKSQIKIQDLLKISVRRIKGDGARLVYHPQKLLIQGYYGQTFCSIRQQIAKYLKK